MHPIKRKVHRSNIGIMVMSQNGVVGGRERLSGSGGGLGNCGDDTG